MRSLLIGMLIVTAGLGVVSVQGPLLMEGAAEDMDAGCEADFSEGIPWKEIEDEDDIKNYQMCDWIDSVLDPSQGGTCLYVLAGAPTPLVCVENSASSWINLIQPNSCPSPTPPAQCIYFDQQIRGRGYPYSTGQADGVTHGFLSNGGNWLLPGGCAWSGSYQASCLNVKQNAMEMIPNPNPFCAAHHAWAAVVVWPYTFQTLNSDVWSPCG